MSQNEYSIKVHYCLSINKNIAISSDKSITHRAIILSSLLSKGYINVIKNWLKSDDCVCTLKAMQRLGVNIKEEHSSLRVKGVGLGGLKQPEDKTIYLGNSGTSMRLLAGLLSAANLDVVLTGDKSLSSRPMGRIIEPLSQMGAKIYSENNNGKSPLIIKPSKLKLISYQLPVASAQVKSALTLAGLYADIKVDIIDNFNTRDHTERMLDCMLPFINNNFDNSTNDIYNRQNFNAEEHILEIDVPGDISTAAFFIVAAIITKRSTLSLINVGVNKTRTGVLKILEQMGARIEYSHQTTINNEPRADITVYSSNLKAITIEPEIVPTAIDEFPIIFIAAACAKGTTIILGLDELKHKESNRIDAMLDGLKALGINAYSYKSGVKIEGGEFAGGVVESRKDHRIAMAFLIAGLVSKNPVTVKNCANISTSCPNFVTILENLTKVERVSYDQQPAY